MKRYKTNDYSIKNGVLLKEFNGYQPFTSLKKGYGFGSLKDGTKVQVLVDNRLKGYVLKDVSGCDNHKRDLLTFSIIKTYKKNYINFRNNKFKKHIVNCTECNIKLIIMTDSNDFNNIQGIMGFK